LADRLIAAFRADHASPLPALSEADDVAFDMLPEPSAHVSWLARLGDSADVRPPAIFRDRARFFEPDGYSEEGEGFGSPEEDLPTLCHALYIAPLGTGLVRSLPAVWRAIRERLLAPTYFHTIYTEHDLYDSSPEQDVRAVNAVLATFGREIPKGLWRGKRVEPDLSAGAQMWPPSGDERMLAHLHWGTLTLFARTQALLDDDPRLAAGDTESVDDLKREMRFVMGDPGDGYIACAERLAGREGYASDPLISAPEAVRDTASLLGVDAHAARLYLLLAALPKPTDRVVRMVTGMSKNAHDASSAQLLAAGLVVDAKRAGAGRNLFVPGAWVAGMEEWKRSRSEGGPWGVVPLPPDQLYAGVLERLRGGDRPRFDEPPKRANKKKANKT
jgi:hypothetical protein